jgi:hypothetical protein
MMEMACRRTPGPARTAILYSSARRDGDLEVETVVFYRACRVIHSKVLLSPSWKAIFGVQSSSSRTRSTYGMRVLTPDGISGMNSHRGRILAIFDSMSATPDIVVISSLATLSKGGGDGNRTRVQGFAGPCLNHSATPPRKLLQRPDDQHRRLTMDPENRRVQTRRCSASPSGRRDSNPRPSPWQGDALPTEPRPRASHPADGAAVMCPACEQNCSRSWPGSKLGFGIRGRNLRCPVFRTPRTVTVRPEMK